MSPAHLLFVVFYFSLLLSLSFASSSSSVTTPITPRVYGMYLLPLNFGTPTQTIHFVLHTSVSFSWLPCTRGYTCTRCNSSLDPFRKFIPKSSSSYKSLACENSQCKTVFPNITCDNKPTSAKECGYTRCLGSETTTSGHLVSETLNVGGLSVDNFAVGCSLSSTNSPGGGVIGFARGSYSLPSRLGLSSFSYCLVSYDNLAATSDLVLTTKKRGSKGSSKDVKYTPFLQNPPKGYKNSYYVSIQNIYVDGVEVKVPGKYLDLDGTTGKGGTIMDTASTFTYMVHPVYDMVFEEFQKQVGEKLHTRTTDFENPMDMDDCYNVSGASARNLKKELPQITFGFLGGPKMVVAMAKYLKHKSVLCMCVHPFKQRAAITLGNYQQQDYYMEYDLENNLLGIRPQKCAA